MTSSTSEPRQAPDRDAARGMRPEAGSAAVDGPGSPTTCVLIEAGGTRYCLDVHRVHGVVPVGSVTQVPGARRSVRGVINVRGRALALADLEAVLTGDAAAEAGRDRSLDAAGGPATAILVGLRDEDVPAFAFLGTVLDVVELDGLEIEPPPAFGLGPAAPLVVGVVRLPSEDLALVLHPERLLAAVGATEAEEVGGSPSAEAARAAEREG